MYKVLKRDGGTVEFDIAKISAANIPPGPNPTTTGRLAGLGVFFGGL